MTGDRPADPADSAGALFAPAALLPSGWAVDVRLDLAADGSLRAVTPGQPAGGLPRLPGPVLPGMPNLHSHAFQRAFAGLAEHRTGVEDSFWTWREAMYRAVQAVDPDAMQAIAAWLYVECLEGGFTSVGEFHYLHHAPDGRPYGDPAELAWRVMAAADAAGIGLCLLPVLYQTGGFGQPPSAGQRRFINSEDALLELISRVRAQMAGRPDRRVGLAPHSLRAVPLGRLSAAVGALHAQDPTAPVHIHVAEQQAEVDGMLAHHGLRPVHALLDRVGIDARWCLVHATHLDPAERLGLQASGAVAGLCPSTEANLGDGLFPARDFIGQGGAFGIGTDSHVCRDAAEELRLLELGQRLLHQRRTVCLPPGEGSVGGGLWRGAQRGGAQALGLPLAGLAPGQRADWVVLRPDHPALLGLSGDKLLDAFIFAAGAGAIDEVWVGGRRQVAEGRHLRRDRLLADYRQALARLR